MSAVPVDPRISVDRRLLVDAMPDRFHRAVEGEHVYRVFHFADDFEGEEEVWSYHFVDEQHPTPEMMAHHRQKFGEVENAINR